MSESAARHEKRALAGSLQPHVLTINGVSSSIRFAVFETGAYAAALGGLGTLVFAGGIGENAPLIRARICAGLGFLGIELESKRNARNAPVISSNRSPVAVRVIRTNEELMIARSVTRVLQLTT